MTTSLPSHAAARLRGAASVLIPLVAVLGISVGPALAQSAGGDAAAGEKVFSKCRSCHQVGEGAKGFAGPVLNGVVGRAAASGTGYPYSDALKGSGLVWQGEDLRAFLSNPRAKVPGTKMQFSGLPRDRDVDDVIAYLSRYGADGTKR